MLSIMQANYAKALAAPARDIPPGLGISTDGSAAIREAKAPRSDAKHPVTLVSDPQLAGSLPENAAVERIVWDKTPMAIALSVGSERMVTFPGAVRLGIPSNLTAHLRSISQNGTVYWLADDTFASTRIQIQDTITGQFYLVDLSATATLQSNARIEIINAAAAVPSNGIPELLSENPDSPAAVTPQPYPEGHKSYFVHNSASNASDYTLLTRYAAQQLYAPARLLKTPHGIHAVPLDGGSVPNDTLMRGGGIGAEPVAAWRKGTLYVTAVKLTNRSLRTIVLDPRVIRGQWRTATFQHAYLAPSNSDENVTALYLVSDRPFAEVY